jgi:alkylation response protein AidB-like acyl-CoA dehydrogenase
MNFNHSVEQINIEAQVQAICDQYCTDAHEAELDKTGCFPHDVFQALAQNGLLAIWPTAAKGSGFLAGCTLNETLSRHSSIASSIAFVNGICGAMLAAGGGNIAGVLLEKLQTGNINLAFALTENTSGSDPRNISTTGTPEGSDFIIDGHKKFTTGAREADYILTVVRTGDSETAGPGMSILAIQRDSPGIIVTPMNKIAGNAHASCEIQFNRVRVPQENLIGKENGALKILFLGSLVERLAVAASMLGCVKQAIDHIVSYLAERKSGGKSVSSHAVIKHQLADLITRYNAMRLMVYHAAWKADSGQDAVAEINMAKNFSVETGHQIVTEALRLAGGNSYLQEAYLYRLWRESTLGFYAGGTSEIIQNTIAKSLNL